MPKCALPTHLQDKKHSDWTWPLSLIDRGWNAKGPRCKDHNDGGYLPWPPKLVEGHNVPRWEWANLAGHHREIFVPAFAGKTIGPEVYRMGRIQALERTGDIVQAVSIDLQAENWWPSIIQYDMVRGWLRLDPKFYCSWDMGAWWKKYYFRTGWRPDAELYYNNGPFLGRKFE